MPIYRGGSVVRAIYRGSTPVVRAFCGAVEVWRRDPVDTVLTSGAGSISVPSYAGVMDIGVIGGGASGATGDNGISSAAGSGAPAAVWQSVSIAVKPGEILDYRIGVGGARRNGVKTSGENGTPTTVSANGDIVVQSLGSPGPAANASNNNATGFGASAAKAAGLALPGSADVSAGNTGSAPGGGGAGGPNINWTGSGSDIWSGGGGRGELRYRFRSF